MTLRIGHNLEHNLEPDVDFWVSIQITSWPLGKLALLITTITVHRRIQIKQSILKSHFAFRSNWTSKLLSQYITQRKYCVPCNSFESVELTTLSIENLDSLELPVEKAMAPHSSTLAWKLPWTEEPGGLQSMGLLRVGHNWATSPSLFTFMYWRRKWQPTPVFLPGESQGPVSLVGCRLWGHTESDPTEATQQQQQQQNFQVQNLKLKLMHRSYPQTSKAAQFIVKYVTAGVSAWFFWVKGNSDWLWTVPPRAGIKFPPYNPFSHKVSVPHSSSSVLGAWDNGHTRDEDQPLTNHSMVVVLKTNHSLLP